MNDEQREQLRALVEAGDAATGCVWECDLDSHNGHPQPDWIGTSELMDDWCREDRRFVVHAANARAALKALLAENAALERVRQLSDVALKQYTVEIEALQAEDAALREAMGEYFKRKDEHEAYRQNARDMEVNAGSKEMLDDAERAARKALEQTNA